jgi:hypothetical protein
MISAQKCGFGVNDVKKLLQDLPNKIRQAMCIVPVLATQLQSRFDGRAGIAGAVTIAGESGRGSSCCAPETDEIERRIAT